MLASLKSVKIISVYLTTGGRGFTGDW